MNSITTLDENCCTPSSGCACHQDYSEFSQNTRLGDLKIGDEALITGYDRTQSRYLNRLLAMGLTRGSRIQVVRRAPLGDPLDIRVRGYNLSLRGEEAAVLLLGPVS